MIALWIIKQQVEHIRASLEEYVEFGCNWQDLQHLSFDCEAIEKNLQVNIEELQKYVSST